MNTTCKRTLSTLFTFTLCLMVCSPFAHGKKIRKWYVDPGMTRAEIQAVIDTAADGGTIIFNQGVYDFSDQPISDGSTNTGLFTIMDKSLTVTGPQHGEALLIGPDSINPTTSSARGLNAFRVFNPDGTRDFTLENLHLDNFLRGVAACHCADAATQNYELNARDIGVRDCLLTNIHRDAIVVICNLGSIEIRDNRMECGRGGIYASWDDFDDPAFCQPVSETLAITGNTIRAGNYGVFVEKPAAVDIRANTIDGGWNFGIYVYGSQKRSRIKSNQLANQGLGINIEGRHHGEIPFHVSDFTISHNSLTGIQYWGISVYGTLAHDNRVFNNSVAMAGDIHFPYYSSGIETDGYNNHIFDNMVFGAATYGIYLFNMSNNANNNLAEGNILAGFSPFVSHYHLEYDTYDNTVIGSWEEGVCYIDNGLGNTVLDIYPCPAAAQPAGVNAVKISDTPKANGITVTRALEH